MGNSGDIFIWHENPVKILDLAKKMIIQKVEVGKDIHIQISGLRPGEKLYEELLLDTENLTETYNDLIYIAKKEVVEQEFSDLVDNLIDLAFNSYDHFKVVGLMKKLCQNIFQIIQNFKF